MGNYWSTTAFCERILFYVSVEDVMLYSTADFDINRKLERNAVFDMFLGYH